MKVSQVLVVAVLAAVLGACNSRREAPTAAFGTEMLAGQVEVSGMPNGSPAGVEVSVRGTGMSMILNESGEFLFSGVPAGAELDFHRASDGIEASMAVDARAGYLTVALTKSTATAKKGTSRRRGVSPTREEQFEGTIVTAAAGSLVLFTSKKVEQTIALTADTVIRKGQTPVAAADLKEGMRVHVKAKKTAEETYTAVLVIVQNEGTDDGEEGTPTAAKEYEGTVRSASSTELVVYTSHREEKTFTITADTVVRKGNTPIKPEDIQAGWRVHVKATGGTATRVTVQNTKK